MKRSEINKIIRRADQFIRGHGWHLPPFAYWSPEEWTTKGPEVQDIVSKNLGWDITDFGSGDYENTGLFLFTLRNGDLGDLRSGRGMLYAEKLLVIDVDQVTPFHFHWLKAEDIINRGGGRLAVQLYNASEDEGFADTGVTVVRDGVRSTVEAGVAVYLSPGESITLPPYCYHEFWGLDETVLCGEVSTVNDDATDNRFYDEVGRFPEIVEDEAPLFLLVNDYDKYYNPPKPDS